MSDFFLCVESVLLDDSTKASSRRNGSVPGTTKPPTTIVYAGSMAPTPSVVIVIVLVALSVLLLPSSLSLSLLGVIVTTVVAVIRCCRHPLLPLPSSLPLPLPLSLSPVALAVIIITVLFV
jgi:hypothetical protein